MLNRGTAEYWTGGGQNIGWENSRIFNSRWAKDVLDRRKVSNFEQQAGGERPTD
jgi:hypothetical protein